MSAPDPAGDSPLDARGRPLLVIIDPAARRTDGESVRIARDVLCAGAQAKICLPEGPEEVARALARRGSRRPVVVGDDQALLHVVRLLQQRRELAEAALSVVPVGSAAAVALARSLGVPTGAVAAARTALDGRAQRLDLLLDDSGGVVLGGLRIPSTSVGGAYGGYEEYQPFGRPPGTPDGLAPSGAGRDAAAAAAGCGPSGTAVPDGPDGPEAGAGPPGTGGPAGPATPAGAAEGRHGAGAARGPSGTSGGGSGELTGDRTGAAAGAPVAGPAVDPGGPAPDGGERHRPGQRPGERPPGDPPAGGAPHQDTAALRPARVPHQAKHQSWWTPAARTARSALALLTGPVPGLGGTTRRRAPLPAQRLRVEADGVLLADLDQPVERVSVSAPGAGLAEVEVLALGASAPVRARARAVTVSGPDFRYHADTLVGGPVRTRTWTVLADAWSLLLPHGEPG
ncbi:diacylglycerol kinase family protein [Streptomyces sp. NPDC018031]|uniref:diacylglycerol kinase family protein n=1 Tax=Streptomyces sp. NPDC018031 TaxID=3365033 RepID=UPI0037B134BA